MFGYGPNLWFFPEEGQRFEFGRAFGLFRGRGSGQGRRTTSDLRFNTATENSIDYFRDRFYMSMVAFLASMVALLGVLLIPDSVNFYVFNRPHRATREEITKFRSSDCIRFLRSIEPNSVGESRVQQADTAFRPRPTGPPWFQRPLRVLPALIQGQHRVGGQVQ